MIACPYCHCSPCKCALLALLLFCAAGCAGLSDKFENATPRRPEPTQTR